jgi:hypothetical protein
MSADVDPTLSFTCDFDERAAFEVAQKGYFEHAIVRLPDGRRMKVFFWDPVRLAQDLEMEQKLGRISIGEPGLILIPKVTVENMQRAIKELYRKGYFDRLGSLVL